MLVTFFNKQSKHASPLYPSSQGVYLYPVICYITTYSDLELRINLVINKKKT